MRNKILLLLTLSVIVLSSSYAQRDIQTLERYWKPNVEKVHVISYNIFNGFDFGKDIDRQERFVNWIKNRNPEVLAMQELYGFTQESLTELANKWGHKYAAIIKEDGCPVGLTSKKPILVKNKILENCGHGLLHVETFGLDFLVTHLNPFNAKERLDEAKFILDYIKKENLENFLLMGDMNAHSPIDADFMDAKGLLKRSGEKENMNLIEGRIDFSTISRFLSYPLIDVCREYVAPDKRATFPTPILMDVSKHKAVRAESQERIDYIFVPVNLIDKVVDAFIFNEGETDYLSDHYPVGVDLLLEK